MPGQQHSHPLDPMPARTTRPLTPPIPHPEPEPVEPGPVERASDSAVLRAIAGARARAALREMRAAVTRMAQQVQSAPVVTPPTTRAIPRFTVGEVVSHPLSGQIGRIAGPPQLWFTSLRWPVRWLRRDGRGGLCWTEAHTAVWQEELVSIQ